MHYVLDENNNKVEAYDKQEVLAAIEKAIADGSLADLVADAAFVTKLKCCVGGGTHQMAFITQAQYNELKARGSVATGCVYFITDDTTVDDINTAIEQLEQKSGDRKSYQHLINYGGCTFTMITQDANAYTNGVDENGDVPLLKALNDICGGRRYPAGGVLLNGDTVQGFYTDVVPMRNNGKLVFLTQRRCYLDGGALKYIESSSNLPSASPVINDIVTEV
jgi:hypothetical protein